MALSNHGDLTTLILAYPDFFWRRSTHFGACCLGLSALHLSGSMGEGEHSQARGPQELKRLSHG